MVDPAYHSPLMCASGHHNWTTWGNFMPVYPHLKAGAWNELPSAKPDRIEAYRWRHCQCGAAEREAYDTRERTLFGPEHRNAKLTPSGQGE